MSLFSALYTSYSGLEVSQAATEVIGNNIANVENNNYTRQRVNLSERDTYPSLHGPMGTGAHVDQIVRLHDEFSFKRFRASSADLENKQFIEKILVEVAEYFPDVHKTGLEQDLNKFFEGWQKLATNPADESQKIVLAENTSQLSKTMKLIYDKMSQTQADLDKQLTSAIDEINRIGKEIVKINKEIRMQEASKYDRANALRDKRDELEVTLSKLIDPVVSKSNIQTLTGIHRHLADYDENYSVMIGGFAIISNDSFHPLALSKGKNSKHGFNNVFFEKSDYSLEDITKDVSGGKVGAILSLRGKYFDPQTGEIQDGFLQKFKNQLDTFSRGLIQSVNTIYAGSSDSIMQSSQIGDTIKLDVNDSQELLAELYPKKLDHEIKKGEMVFSVYDLAGYEKQEVKVFIDPTKQNLHHIAKTIDKAFEDAKIDASASVELGMLSIKHGVSHRGDETGAVLLKRDDTLISDALRMTGVRNLELVDRLDIPFDIENGKFTINVYNENGQTLSSRQITIDKNTKNPLYSTIDGIVAQINMAHTDDNKDNNFSNDVDDFLKATFSGNKLIINTKDKNSGLKFNITSDETGFSGAVGLHKFFDGNSASNMALAQNLAQKNSNINAYGRSVKGDNEVANKMQQLQYDNVRFYNKDGSISTETIMGQYRYVAGTVASDTHDMQIKVQTANAVYKAAQKQHRAISGVNIDEEMVNLIRFQTGYGANARVISTIQTMLDTLLSIKN